MAEGVEVPINPQINETANKYFREADPDELKVLKDFIGEKALNFVTEKGIRIDTVGISDLGIKFALEIGDKAVEIRAYEGEKKTVQINFKALKYLGVNEPKKESSEEALAPYLETEKTNLTKETLKFLKFVGNFVLEIDPDCKVIILPSSKRREKIYRRFLNSEEHPNIKIADALENDIKYKKIA